MTPGFIQRLFEMSKEAKESGDHEMSQNLAYSVIAAIRPDVATPETFDRDDIAILITRLGEFAMRNGHKYAAYNLAFISLAMIAGEEFEVLLGSEMAKHADQLKSYAHQNNLMWPEDLE